MTNICLICFEKLVCNYRMTGSDGALDEEMECPNRHFRVRSHDQIIEAVLGGSPTQSHFSLSSADEQTWPAHTRDHWNAVVAGIRHEEAEIETNYRTFWKSVIEPGGQLCLSQVKRELYDYHQFMQEAAKVYMHVTGGRISKVNTDSGAVIREADDLLSREIDEALEFQGRGADEVVSRL